MKDTLSAWLLRCALTGKPTQVELGGYVVCFDWKPFKLRRVVSYSVWWPQVCAQPIPVRVHLRSRGGDKQEDRVSALTGYLFLDGPEAGGITVRPTADSKDVGQWVDFPQVIRFETADPEQGGLLWDDDDPYD